MVQALNEQHCTQEARQLKTTKARALMPQLHTDWSMDDSEPALQRCFRFKNYYQTIAFVNALAWVAHREDHHPDLEVGYNRCTVHYSTHSVGGLSENDFICASRIDALTPDS